MQSSALRPYQCLAIFKFRDECVFDLSSTFVSLEKHNFTCEFSDLLKMHYKNCLSVRATMLSSKGLKTTIIVINIIIIILINIVAISTFIALKCK